MKKILLIAALLGLGLAVAAGDARACCHKKKAACAPPAPVCEPAPVVYEPAPVACEPAPKKHCFKMPKLFAGCHKKKKTVACETASYAAPAYHAAPMGYAAPAYHAAPSAQFSPYASPHASPQF